ncbi:replication initiator protein A [Dorea formicigenerans]|uniref:replication initiator protein A n=1 Tax=Dorea formicigenerans TaxID=39486 RepID=UPI0015705261|nr:replication initiator protein A [Dorea formicigenerans]NSE60828.1 hypothetical protein [Dorea formicigenerans]NSE87363.1 hypothetical protein [Dorea formicigenerans]
MTDFLTADTNLPSYMMFPRFLLDMEINETAKMLYIILLDRARLSQKNEGWSDTDGHVFIYFTIEALAEVLHKEIKKNNLAIRGSKEPLSPYGKFQNVFLSEKELEDIRQTIPDWKDYIERLSGYMASTGKQYQNHAATIISWARQDHPASRKRNYESEEYETL